MPKRSASLLLLWAIDTMFTIYIVEYYYYGRRLFLLLRHMYSAIVRHFFNSDKQSSSKEKTTTLNRSCESSTCLSSPFYPTKSAPLVFKKSYHTRFCERLDFASLVTALSWFLLASGVKATKPSTECSLNHISSSLASRKMMLSRWSRATAFPPKIAPSGRSSCENS